MCSIALLPSTKCVLSRVSCTVLALCFCAAQSEHPLDACYHEPEAPQFACADAFSLLVRPQCSLHSQMPVAVLTVLHTL